jgi:hypothetical protein
LNQAAHPLGLNPGVLKKLEQVFRDCLRHLKIRNDYFVDLNSWLFLALCNEVISKESKVFREGSKEIDEVLFATFVIDWIERQIRKNHEYSSSEFVKKLEDFQEFRDQDSFVNQLLADFTELPHQNLLVVELNTNLSEILKKLGPEISLSSEVSIVTIPEKLRKFPKSTGSEKLDHKIFGRSLLWIPTDRDREWSPASAYLIARNEGFSNSNGTTHSLQELVSKVRSVLASLLCTEALKLESGGYTPMRIRTRAPFFRELNGVCELLGAVDLPDDVSEIITRSSVNHSRIGEPSETAHIEFDKHLNLVRAAFGHESTSAKVQTAVNWYAFSITNDDWVTSFVQAMVCLEAVLGDRDSGILSGKSKPIADKAAYLIAKRTSEREAILTDIP